MLGAHLSIAGGLHQALVEGRRLGVQAVQLFTKNQQQWRCPPLTAEAVVLWRQQQSETGLTRTISHDSYLINLAGPPGPVRQQSLELFVRELERCRDLGIAHLVAHPGCHMGAGEDAGLARVVEALDQAYEQLPDVGVVTCLELTAGQGTSVGWRLEHLRRIIDTARRPDRLAVCLDTAHLLAAGYDLTGPRAARGVLAEVDAVVGLARVAVVHVNDSKTPLGSRVDRHEHIGSGHIPLSVFRVILNHPALAGVPKIIETPKGPAPDGQSWDAVNLAALRGLLPSAGR